MGTNLVNWALPRIARLLPIDDESLKEIIAYSSSISKESGAEHLKNLLGDSAPALDFIAGFNSRREDVAPANEHMSKSRTPQHTDSEGIPNSRKRAPKKPKAPLHKTGPVRQPEGHGNITGGYQKSYVDESYMPGLSSQGPAGKSLANALALSQEPAALHVPHVSNMSTASPAISRSPSPGYGRQKLPPSAAGNLISDLPNVRSKVSKNRTSGHYSGNASPRTGPVTTTTSSIQDLTSAIAALELATNPTLSSDRRICQCNASIHPLFETAPNCLSCGKIICALEGLQPCSYCNAPILSKAQVDGMIRALKEERGVERIATHNAGVASGRGTPMFGASTPDSSSGDEASSAAVRARAHRDRLLAFQRENAQRTRVHDEAADYDATLTPGATQWMSPLQRAAALKKQQKYLREIEEASRPEWEKKRTVMSMSIKNGKLVKTYGREKAPALEVDRDDGQDEVSENNMASQPTRNEQRGAFSNNPLLVTGKLVRPIWKRKGDATIGEESVTQRTRPSVWRRVQDDNEDNEQWILDGGLHGYGTETRLMEDGSQQECG